MSNTKTIKYEGQQFTIVYTTSPPEPPVGLFKEQVEEIREVYWRKREGMDFNITDLFFALCNDQCIREVENILLA